MIKLFHSLILILVCLNVYAQSINETAYFVIDKSVYQPYDTLYLKGVLLNPESRAISKLSNYCYIELINREATVLQRSKVRCDNGIFNCALTLDSIQRDGYYFIRAYTRYMQNFPPASYPIQFFQIGNQRQSLSLKQRRSRFPFQLRFKNGVLLYKLDESLKGRKYVLTVAANDGSMETISLEEHPQGNLQIINKTVPYLLNCFVTDVVTDSIVFQQYVPVAESTNDFLINLPVSRYQANGELRFDLPTSLRDTYSIVYINQGEPRTLLSEQLKNASLMNGKLYKELIQGNGFIHYLPEEVLSICGYVNKEYAGRLKGGLMTAFDSQRGLHYDADIQNDGSFVMGLDDYSENTAFYLEAFNTKGKSNYYELTLHCDTFPDVYLPPLKWKNSWGDISYSQWDTTDVHWIPEVQVKARIIKKAPPSTSMFYKNRYLDAKDLALGSLNNLEPVFRRLVGIQIAVTDDGFPYLVGTRGASTLKEKAKTRYVKSEEGELSASRPGIRIRVDGVWDDSWDLYELVNVSEIASIEYIPASRSSIYGPGNLDGVIEIKTKSILKDSSSVKSAGMVYTPLGLSFWPKEKIPQTAVIIHQSAEEKRQCILRLPARPGTYRIIAEGFTNIGELIYFSREIKVE